MDKKNSPPTLPATAQSIIDILYRKDGDRDRRPVHMTGIAATGHFKASDLAPL